MFKACFALASAVLMLPAHCYSHSMQMFFKVLQWLESEGDCSLSFVHNHLKTPAISVSISCLVKFVFPTSNQGLENVQFVVFDDISHQTFYHTNMYFNCLLYVGEQMFGWRRECWPYCGCTASGGGLMNGCDHMGERSDGCLFLSPMFSQRCSIEWFLVSFGFQCGKLSAQPGYIGDLQTSTFGIVMSPKGGVFLMGRHVFVIPLHSSHDCVDVSLGGTFSTQTWYYDCLLVFFRNTGVATGCLHRLFSELNRS